MPAGKASRARRAPVACSTTACTTSIASATSTTSPTSSGQEGRKAIRVPAPCPTRSNTARDSHKAGPATRHAATAWRDKTVTEIGFYQAVLAGSWAVTRCGFCKKISRSIRTRANQSKLEEPSARGKQRARWPGPRVLEFRFRYGYNFGANSTFGTFFASGGASNSLYSLKPNIFAVTLAGNCRRDVL